MISYLQQGRLTLHCGQALPTEQSLLVAAGQRELAAGLMYQPSAEALLAALVEAYEQGYEQFASTEFELKGVAVAGYGDPLLALDILAEVLPVFKAQRHGVPITLITYGLVPAAQRELLCQQLVELEVERLEIYLPAANPVAYQKAVKPLQAGFADVCQFIQQATEAGIQVSCFAYAPIKQQAELRALAKALGAQDFFYSTF